MKKTFRLSDSVPDPKKDVDDELTFHLEMRTREFMEQGIPEDEARRRAQDSFGDVASIRRSLQRERAERNASRWWHDWVTGLGSDLRYALRSLRTNIGFTIAAVATLTLGIGANSAIFSIVNGVLVRPLAFPEPDRLVVLWGKYPTFGRSSLSLPDFLDWRAQATTMEQVAARYGTVFNLTGTGEPLQVRADRVTANFFTTLGVQPTLGRGFLPDEDRGGDDRVVVLSHGFWQRQFGASPALVGSTIPLSGEQYTVVGITPPEFRFWRDVDLWAPANIDLPNANRRNEFMTAFARLKPGVAVEQGAAEIATIAKRLSEQYPATNLTFQSEVVSLQDETVASVRPALLVFAGAVGLVLLIACANVASLLLVRATGREREVAVRSALGASRARLVRQMLTESTLIGMLGGIGGLVLATWAVSALRATETTLLPRLRDVQIDSTVILFSLGLSLATGFLFGLAPAMRLLSNRLHQFLKEGSRGAAGGSVTRIRRGLVLVEVALAVVLLVGAGLLIRSFEKLNGVDPGFEPSGILTYQAAFPASRYADAAALVPLYDQILERTKGVPRARAAALSSTLPMAGSGYWSFAIEGVPAPASDPNAAPIDVQPFRVSPDYAQVMGIKLQRGRFIETRDAAGAPRVAVVNSEMVRRYFPAGRDPIGMRVTFGNPTDSTGYMTVVGVVDPVTQEGLDAAPYSQVYVPLAQLPGRSVFVSIKTDADPMSLLPDARQALRSVDAEVPLNDARRMEDRVSENIAATKISVTVLSAFAGLALVLAAIGIYGVLAYSVAQRTREIGIRMALGANAGTLRALIVGQGMMPVVMGLAVGLVGAFLATRLMQKLLFGVAPTDPATFVLVGVFLTVVALGATYLPARRASRIVPTEALRAE